MCTLYPVLLAGFLNPSFVGFCTYGWALAYSDEVSEDLATYRHTPYSIPQHRIGVLTEARERAIESVDDEKAKCNCNSGVRFSVRLKPDIIGHENLYPTLGRYMEYTFVRVAWGKATPLPLSSLRPSFSPSLPASLSLPLTIFLSFRK